MTKEVMQQALEALAIADNIALVGAAYTPKSIDRGLRKIRESATALRTALAQPEPKPVACRFCHSEKGCWAWQCYDCGEIDDVQQPPPLPEQEPEAWMSSDRAWMWSDYSKAIAAVANIPTLTLIPLYAAPPQREWQGLTDEEIWSADPRIGTSDSNVNPYQILINARAIEATLKRKNHG
jgi:hypothetical protein